MSCTNTHRALQQFRVRIPPVFVLLISFLLAPRLDAQTVLAEHWVTYLPQGFVLTQLSGQGIAGAVESSLANLPAANPALMAEYTTLSAGASLQAETTIKPGWIADIGYRRPPKRLIQSAGVVPPSKQLRIGLGYFQKYSAEMLYDSVRTTALSDSGYISLYVQPHGHAAIDAWTLSGSFLAHGLLTPGDQMSVGLSIQYNCLEYFQSVDGWGEIYDEDAGQITFAAGWMYASPKNLDCRVKLGIHYEQGVDIQGTGAYSDPEEGDGKFALTGRTPSRLYTGIRIELGQRLSLTTGNNWVAWKEVRDEVIDQHEYTLSLALQWSSSLITTLGLFSTDMRHSIGPFFSPSDDVFQATYLIFGLSKQLGPLSLDAVIADSHRNSGALIERTILKLGLGVHL
ncbi:hypothetical protein ACFL45_10345 [Candidatus Neomarinimicrobiota bacterium]